MERCQSPAMATQGPVEVRASQLNRSRTIRSERSVAFNIATFRQAPGDTRAALSEFCCVCLKFAVSQPLLAGRRRSGCNQTSTKRRIYPGGTRFSFLPENSHDKSSLFPGIGLISQPGFFCPSPAGLLRSRYWPRRKGCCRFPFHREGRSC